MNKGSKNNFFLKKSTFQALELKSFTPSFKYPNHLSSEAESGLQWLAVACGGLRWLAVACSGAHLTVSC